MEIFEKFIWFQGVVEDVNDPLMIGRVKVRIIYFHSDDKIDMPTTLLPWAMVLIPTSHGSNTGAGFSPHGLTDGSHVLGFFRDGKSGQEPVILGSFHGIPSQKPIINKGFNDSRKDIFSDDLYFIDKDGGVTSPRISSASFPYPPKSVTHKAFSAPIIQEFEQNSKLLNPRWINKQTTSKYAIGTSDITSRVIPYQSVSESNPDELINVSAAELRSESIISDKIYKAESMFAKVQSATRSFSEPITPYASKYPHNKVSETSSGHLIEIDDTPGAERLHWYHRTGTFTEFHPSGTRVDKTAYKKFDLTCGSLYQSVGGEHLSYFGRGYEEKIGGTYSGVIGGNYQLDAMKGYKITSVLNNEITSLKDLVLTGKQNILFNSKNFVSSFGSLSQSTTGNSTEVIGGSKLINTGGFAVNTTGNIAMNTTGNSTSSINGVERKTILNSFVGLGEEYGSKTQSLFGKIGLESSDAILTGGVHMNLGLNGLAAKIHLKAPSGNIDIISTTGTHGITLDATSMIAIKSLIMTEMQSVYTKIKSDMLTEIESKFIFLGGNSNPAVLGKELIDVLKDHKHLTANGPTDGMMPQFAMKLLQTVSKKTFLD